MDNNDRYLSLSRGIVSTSPVRDRCLHVCLSEAPVALLPPPFCLDERFVAESAGDVPGNGEAREAFELMH